MTMPYFVDTNVLIYSRDESEPEKQPRAQRWLARLWDTRQGRTSFQVLQEYYWIATRRIRTPLSPEVAQADVRDLLLWRPLAIDAAVLERAWQIEGRFGFGLWDALILAAAQMSGCGYLLSEDMQHGQDVDGLRVVNPFLVDPEAVSWPDG
jgi:predicted nucleic acid-binding protein